MKLENAMYYSGVSQFINQLNEGLNTVVGEEAHHFPVDKFKE